MTLKYEKMLKMYLTTFMWWKEMEKSIKSVRLWGRRAKHEQIVGAFLSSLELIYQNKSATEKKF